MFKKSFIASALLCCSLVASAAPAKPGVYRTVKLADGTEVKVELRGDERFHFYVDSEGNNYEQTRTGAFRRATIGDLNLRKAMSKRLNSARTTHGFGTPIDKSVFQGTRNGLIILVNFADVKFMPDNNLELYKNIANKTNFKHKNFTMSVQDYFHAQSYGKFTLDFDVVGPVEMPYTASYYGTNDTAGEDMHVGEMIAEACKQAHEKHGINFKKYDWNGDGKVDQVYVVYAGKGAADSSEPNVIWPQSWTLHESDYKKTLEYDGVTIDQYACSNEIDGEDHIEGIGLICHEFSHCMGFPDTYDISYNGSYGMGNWDLMDNGNYRGDGFTPVGYTAYERMMCGWNEPIVLEGDTAIKNIKPASEQGNTYIIYNKAYKDEYYLLEYRDQLGTDKYIPAPGMLVTHVDFNKVAWDNNIVNTVGHITDNGKLVMDNYHQRLTLIHADNDDDSEYWSKMTKIHVKKTETTDPFPYGYCDSLTNRSIPAARLYNPNLNGRKQMNVAIRHIALDTAKHIMSFDFEDFSTKVTELGDNELFVETFNYCNAKGGNDNNWKGTAGEGVFDPDNEDWECEKKKGGNKCAKFGSNQKPGVVTTPQFNVPGTATFKFKAAPYDKDGTALKLSVNGGKIEPANFKLEKGKWTECTATITANGPVTVTFTPEKRLFLDEVFATGNRPKGDINCDGLVNAADVTALTNRILNLENYRDKVCDLNGDKVVNVSDITILTGLIGGNK